MESFGKKFGPPEQETSDRFNSKKYCAVTVLRIAKTTHI